MDLSVGSVIKCSWQSLKNKWLIVLISFAVAFCAFSLTAMVAEMAQYVASLSYMYITDEKSVEALNSSLYTLFTVLSYASSLFINMPLFLGFERIVWTVVNGDTPSVSDTFWCYSLHRLIKAVGLKVTIGLRLSLWASVFFIPARLAEYYLPLITANWVAAYVKYLIIGIGVCFVLAKLISYSAADFIFFENETMKTSKIISSSAALLGIRSGNLGETILLMICLVPILLSCAVVLPLVVAVPFYTACVATFVSRTMGTA